MTNNIKYLDFTTSNKESINIALVSLLSTEIEWKNNVKGGLVDNSKKIDEVLKVVRAIIKSKQKVDYVLFPELSIPREIIIYISEKLLKYGASVIAGIEYRHISNPDTSSEIKVFVKNEMVYFLTLKSGSFSEHLAIVQEKVIPAIHEEKDLFDIGGKKLICNDDTKFIIKHNDAVFSTLICNEFLDINLRSQLRGKVDLLFILEWNKDTNTYDSLVNATANDLHCFIAQVNNRDFGDTRIRAPYAKDYKRDVVKIKGGEYDYFVVGKVEFNKLREFQSLHRGVSGEFKPLPTGYVLNEKEKKTYK
jgi:hypothetical protein